MAELTVHRTQSLSLLVLPLEVVHILIRVVYKYGELDIVLVVLSQVFQCPGHEILKSLDIASLKNADFVVDDAVAFELAGN